MSKKTIPIKFQYFYVMNSRKSEKYDLLPWIKEIYAQEVEKRIRDVLGAKGRLEDMCWVENDQYLALNFMRMDENSNSYIVPQEKRAEHIALEEDQYIGKNTVALYDPKLYVLLVQCNKGGFSVGMIEQYINSYFKEPYYSLVPIISEVKGILQKNKRKLILTVEDLRRINYTDCKSDVFERILSAGKDTGAITARIELGMGYEHYRQLDDESLMPFLEDVKNESNKDAIKKAQVVLDEYEAPEQIMEMSMVPQECKKDPKRKKR